MSNIHIYKKGLFISGILVALFILSFPVYAEQWFEYYQEAKMCAERGNWENAIELFHKAIGDDPHSEQFKTITWMKFSEYYPYLHLGLAYLAIHDIDNADKYCTQAQKEGVAPQAEIERCLAEVAVARKMGTFKNLPAPIPGFPKFPWPPPKASASANIPSQLLISPDVETFLGDIAIHLEEALDQAGYVEKSYYYVPEGFALVTRIEQFYPDGSPKELPDRWALEILPPQKFSIKTYLDALFKARKGHYRIIAFIVTSQLYYQSPTTVSRDEAEAWLRRGCKILPPEIGKLPYTGAHYCTALIYEFEQVTQDHEPEFKDPSQLLGLDHLKKAHVWEGLD